MFLLINYKTKERYLCDWFKHNELFHNQTVHYIGLDGLGGYNQMLAKGFIDRRFEKPLNKPMCKSIFDHKRRVWEIANKRRSLKEAKELELAHPHLKQLMLF